MNDSDSSKEVTLIAAASENNALGKDNKLIWHLSKDLQHFKTLTNGHAVIMGRKTFESMPRALPNRTNIIITRQSDYQAENITVCSSLSEALTIAKDDPRPFIIGGGEIYSQLIDSCDELLVTKIHREIDGDAFFPMIDLSVWSLVDQSEKLNENDIEFSYLTYRKI